MRVLQLGPYPPPHGGVQANLSAIRDALLANGDECPVVVITRSDASVVAEPDVYRPNGPIDLLGTLLRVDADIVHLHLGGNLTPRLLALTLLCAWLPGRRSVLTFHSGGYPNTPQGRNARRGTIRGLVFRQLDQVIGVNAEIVEMFKRFGVAENRVRLISPHAIPRVDHSLALPEPLKQFVARHEPVLISVGLLEPEYDLPAQINLLAPLRRVFPQAGLIMVGSGSLEPELRERIATNPESDHLLLSGDLAHDHTLLLMTECSLMLRTTLYDGDSISVREAIALGLPVVATDNAMRPAGTNLVPANDPVALLSSVIQILRTGKTAASSTRESEDNIAKVLALYDELLPSSK